MKSSTKAGPISWGCMGHVRLIALNKTYSTHVDDDSNMWFAAASTRPSCKIVML